jgi:hypothetical protein
VEERRVPHPELGSGIAATPDRREEPAFKKSVIDHAFTSLMVSIAGGFQPANW